MAGPQPDVIGTDNGDIINPNGTSAGVNGTVTAGKDIINSFGGNDVVEGGGGDDTVFMGDGTDTFIWKPGDGSDFVFGGDDIDTLVFNAASAFGNIEVTANGPDVFGDDERAAAVFSIAGTVEIEEVDHVKITTGPQGKFVTIAGLDGTSVSKVAVDLAAAAGSSSANGVADGLLIGGTDGNDNIAIASIGSAIRVSGLSAEVTITHADAGKDELAIVASDGNDVLDASQLKAGSSILFLLGGDGNDTLIGGASAAHLAGGDTEGEDRGIDTASYSASNAGISVTLVTGKGSGGHAEGDELLEIENLIASAFADTLTGDGEANVLDGRAGNDTLTGGGAADKLRGGDGIDTASYATSAAAVNVNLAAGTGTGGDATGDTFSSIENLVGSAFADTLTGNAANNTLDGRAGADTMTGGAGNDIYVVDNAGDKVIEAAGGGTDTIVSSIAFTLGADVENLVLTGVADSVAKATGASVQGSGNALANSMTGSDGANRLDGAAGDDVLAGGLGKDKLVGDRGLDSFVFDAALGKANADRIADFKKADSFLLDDAIFQGLSLGELKKNAYFEGTKAHDANDRVIVTDKGKLLFDQDGKGGEKAVLFAKVGKEADLSHHDFIAI